MKQKTSPHRLNKGSNLKSPVGDPHATDEDWRTQLPKRDNKNKDEYNSLQVIIIHFYILKPIIQEISGCLQIKIMFSDVSMLEKLNLSKTIFIISNDKTST